jgi:peptide/nickel transport system ATP-binding protein
MSKAYGSSESLRERGDCLALPPMPLLRIENLCVDIPHGRGIARVLENISFELCAGERLGIVGESGCGKSMTALAIMGLLPPAASACGRILFRGEDLLSAAERRLCQIRGRRIAMVFQEPMSALNPVHSIGHQVAEGLRLHLRLGRSEAEQRALRLLERVGLPQPRFSPDLFPHQLSGGQRQRVVLAIALACGPDLLIADEPTTALDVTIQAQILELVDEIASESGMALIMISHDLGVIAETTDRMLVMYAGRIVENGPTEQVFERLAHPYTRSLFAALPQLACGAKTSRARLPAIPGRVPDATERPPGCPFVERCGRATEECRAAFPQAVTLGDDHLVHCFHPHEVDPRPLISARARAPSLDGTEHRC